MVSQNGFPRKHSHRKELLSILGKRLFARFFPQCRRFLPSGLILLIGHVSWLQLPFLSVRGPSVQMLPDTDPKFLDMAPPGHGPGNSKMIRRREVYSRHGFDSGRARVRVSFSGWWALGESRHGFGLWFRVSLSFGIRARISNSRCRMASHIVPRGCVSTEEAWTLIL